ncbi:transmembrane protein [Perilla frutescens var. frutescens]|nr:transmembrane protein [Perilla frutescens var. frutescens]
MSLRPRSSSIPKQTSVEKEVVSLTQTRRSPQTVLTQALQSSANLANLLPTGTIFAFQLLTPIFTNGGSCDTTTRPTALLIVLAISCLLASFTDSIKCANGDVHYGFVTTKGLWMFDFSNASASGLPDLSKYRLKMMDVMHALLSLSVFVAVALRDKNVVRCFYPMPGNEAQQMLDVVPVAIGFVSSLLFVLFPTKRHGIGYPVTRDD